MSDQAKGSQSKMVHEMSGVNNQVNNQVIPTGSTTPDSLLEVDPLEDAQFAPGMKEFFMSVRSDAGFGMGDVAKIQPGKALRAGPQEPFGNGKLTVACPVNCVFGSNHAGLGGY